MNWLVKADDWVDAKMFRPLVVKICQTLDWTQYQLNRNIWALVMVLAAVVNWSWGPSLFMTLVTSFVATVQVGKAIFSPPMKPEGESIFFRLLIWVFGAVTSVLILHPLVPLYFLILLLAEYASKITHVPPAKPRSYSFGQLAQQA